MEDDDYRKYGNSRAAHYDIADPHKCFVCGGPVKDEEIVCHKCGFPQNGDDASQRQFLGHLRGEKNELALEGYRVWHAFNLLLVMPIVLILAANIYRQREQDTIAEVVALFAIAFFIIWLFGRKRPYRAFGLSLALYALLTVPVFIYYPVIIMNTRCWILAPYVFLPIGMFSFKNWKEMDDDLKGKNTG